MSDEAWRACPRPQITPLSDLSRSMAYVISLPCQNEVVGMRAGVDEVGRATFGHLPWAACGAAKKEINR